MALPQSTLLATGLELDRQWMCVDEAGTFLSQRELPRMALVQPKLRFGELVLRAPGMMALHLNLQHVPDAPPVRVTVWSDTVRALDMGELAAQWCSDFLGRRVRLVRFHPEEERLSDMQWTGALHAPTAFSDGFALLVVAQASLDELNRRLKARGLAEVGMERFRPNVVLGGLDAHDEDHVQQLTIATPQGEVVLKLVKPCARCSIPDVDPLTAHCGHAVSDELGRYRSDPRVKGAATFGMNAVVVQGSGLTLAVGQSAQAEWSFG